MIYVCLAVKVSLTIEIYHVVKIDIQEQCQQPVLFWETLEPPRPITAREAFYAFYCDLCLKTHVFWEGYHQHVRGNYFLISFKIAF